MNPVNKMCEFIDTLITGYLISIQYCHVRIGMEFLLTCSFLLVLEYYGLDDSSLSTGGERKYKEISTFGYPNAD